MPANPIPYPPPAPNRTNEPDLFNSRANDTMAYWPVFVSALNQAMPYINGAAQVGPSAIGAANFKGLWSDLHGARAIPTTVLHNGSIWLLTQNIQDVAAHEPGVSPHWADLTGILDAFPAGEIGNYVAKADAATVQQFLAAASGKHLRAGMVWSAAAVDPLIDAPTITPDFGEALNFSVTIEGNRTLGSPVGGQIGQSGFIEVFQGGTGAFTLSFASRYVFQDGNAPLLSASGGARTVLPYLIIGGGDVLITTLVGVSQ